MPANFVFISSTLLVCLHLVNCSSCPLGWRMTYSGRACLRTTSLPTLGSKAADACSRAFDAAVLANASDPELMRLIGELTRSGGPLWATGCSKLPLEKSVSRKKHCCALQSDGREVETDCLELHKALCVTPSWLSRHRRNSNNNLFNMFSSQTSAPDASSNLGGILGGVSGSAAAIFAIVMICCCCCLCAKKKVKPARQMDVVTVQRVNV